MSASPALNAEEAVRPRYLRTFALIGLLAISGFVVSCNSDHPSTVAPLPTPSQTATGSGPAPGTRSSTGSATKPKPTPRTSGSSATFKHFRVTVSRIARNGSTVNVQAKVCVRRLPPDPQCDRTRISWDPWSIRTSSGTLHPKLSHSPRDHLYPSDETYRVGECASGWIPFRTGSTVLKVRYANGVGNVAIWDATNLDKKTQISSGVNVKSEPKMRDQNHDVNYENCDAVRAAGEAPIRRGDPGYAPHLDRDNDGIGCES